MALPWYLRPGKREERLPLAREAVFTHRTFELRDLGYAMLRVTAFARQGYRNYLNGNLTAGSGSRSEIWAPRGHYVKTDRNTVAATSFLQRLRGKAGNIEVYAEGLKSFPRVAG